MEFKNYHLITDTASDIPEELIKEYNITVLPFGITINQKFYEDTRLLTAEKLNELVKASAELPKSSAISPSTFEKMFSSFPDDDLIIYAGLGSGFSVTFNNSLQASKKFKNVFVFDSENLSSGAGVFVLNIAKWLKDKKTITEIKSLVNDLKERLMVYFALDTLEFMHKGGRCSGLVKFIATRLKIKPIIKIKDNKAGVGKKPRGSYERAVETMNDMFRRDLENNNIDPNFVFVTTTLGYEDREKMFNEFKDNKSINLLRAQAGSVVFTHCGPRTTGFCYARKQK